MIDGRGKLIRVVRHYVAFFVYSGHVQSSNYLRSNQNMLLLGYGAIKMALKDLLRVKKFKNHQFITMNKI